jgi:hypothetical protein
MYSAPFDGEVAEAEPPRQPIINRNHMFSPGSMNPWKFRRYSQKEKVQRERTNIDTPTEMPELWGEYTEDQMLDPAERCRHDMVQVGSEVSLKKDFEVRERGGSQIVIPSGEEGKVIKDMKGDGMCMVVHFPVMHLDAVVPVKFLKGASFNQKADSQVEVPKASGGTELENILKGVSSSPFDRSAAVKDVWQTTKEKMPEHAKTLMGERPAGSQWGGEGFGEQHLDLPWEDVTEKVPEGAKMPGAKYWHLPPEHRKQHFPQANVGAVPMTELPANLLSKVQMAQGAHGKELQIREEDLPPELLEQAGEFGAHLITGPEEGVGDVVYTAFPGPIMAPLPRNFEGDVSELMKHGKPYAVKVVKGTKTAGKIEDLKQQLHDLYREQDELKGDIGFDRRQRYLGITKRIDALKAEIAKLESKHQAAEDKPFNRAWPTPEDPDGMRYMRTRKEEEDRERERERIRKEKERETPAQKGGQKRAATVEQVKHEIREMLREGYQDIDIQAAITQKYPDVAEEALSGLK